MLSALGSSAMSTLGAYGARRLIRRFTKRRSPYRTYNRKFAKRVKRVIGYKPELKYDDTSSVGFAPAIGGSWWYINNGIQEGTGYSQRVGRGVCAKYLEIKAQLFAPVNTTPPLLPDAMRICLVYDKTPNHSLPAISDVFETGAPENIAPFTAPKNIKMNADRFHIVHDWHSGMVGLGGTNGETYYHLNYKIPERWTRTIYNDSGLAIPNSGGWLLFICTAQNTSSGSNTSCSAQIMTRFAFLDF